MIKSPSDIVDTNSSQPIPKCIDPLPADTYPMPRCISNILANYRLNKFDIGKAMTYRSKRRTNHLVKNLLFNNNCFLKLIFRIN